MTALHAPALSPSSPGMTRERNKPVCVLLSILVPLTLAAGIASGGNHIGAPATPDLIVYGDALASGWQDWSWNTTDSLTNASPVLGGSGHSVAVTLTAAWAGFSLRSPAPIATGGFSAVRFWVYGGAGGNPLLAYIQASDDGPASPGHAFTALAGAWTPVTITLAALGNPAFIQRIDVQDNSGHAQPVFFLDDMRLLGTPSGTTTNIQVDAGAPGAPFTPHLLGSNLPAWLGPAILADPDFRTRTAAAGIGMLRIPGGSWSDDYGWLSCEMATNVSGAMPCPALGWGARPTDFISTTRAVHAEALWIVNVNSTSKEAAAAVAFFNSRLTDTTPIGLDIHGTNWYTAGHWAALRAQHGNPEPLGIRYWEFGNEVYGGKPGTGAADCQPWGWETSWTCDGAEYVTGIGSGAARHEGYREFRAAMRAVDPAVQLGAAGTTDLSSYADWGTKVISAAGSVLDFYVVHPYAYDTPPANDASGWAQVMALPQSHWSGVRSALQPAFNNYAAGRSAPLAATEYNIVSAWPFDSEQMMLRAGNALYTADSIGQMAQSGYEFALQWDLANGTAANGTDYGLLRMDGGYMRTPAYYAFALWSRFGSTILPVTSSANAATDFSVYAGRVDSTTVTLLAVNKTSAPLTATITVSGAGPLLGGTASVVSTTSPSVLAVTFNGIANPASDLSNAPPLPFATGGGPVFDYTFAPTSVTLLTVRTGALGRHVFLPAIRR